MATQVIWEKDHFVVRHHGTLTIKDCIYMYDKIVGNSKYDKLRFGIIDTRDVEDMEYSETEVKIHAAYAGVAAQMSRKSRFKVAVIVTHPKVLDFSKKLLPIYNNHRKHWTRKVFSNLDEGNSWASSNGI